MRKLQRRAYAKINLSLDVLGVRDDGYHSVEMVMVRLSLYDLVTVSKAPSGINLTNSLSFLPTGAENLAYRAAEAFFKYTSISGGVKIHIEKRIPVGAGLAGGSSDAAAVLDAMNTLFEAKLSKEELCTIGATLGADVPFCIVGGTCLATGIGEELSPLPDMPRCHVVLVKPAFSISTPWVYSRVDSCTIVHPPTKRLIECLEKGDLRGLCNAMGNVLEAVSIAEYPVLEGAKSDLRDMGAIGVLMSGSGPTVFGVFEREEDAKRAKDTLWGKYKTVYTAIPMKGGKL